MPGRKDARTSETLFMEVPPQTPFSYSITLRGHGPSCGLLFVLKQGGTKKSACLPVFQRTDSKERAEILWT